VPDAKRLVVDAKDDEIEERVERQLAASDHLRDTRISVDVENGVARLTGTVPSQEDRLLAAVTARQTAGVRAGKADRTVRR
jgi:osmotically-inducible protein OsmY